MIIIQLDSEQLDSLIQTAVSKALNNSSNHRTSTSSEELLTVEQCAKFLSLSKQTIYGLISKRKIPYMKRGKRCYFSKPELIEYIKKGRKKTSLDLENEINDYLHTKGQNNG